MGDADMVVDARILYWGVSGAGKSANLEHIHGKLRPDHRGDLQRIASPEDPGVAYELMPIELGKISGVRTRLQIVAPPGAADQVATRQLLLDQVDGIVFVVDSRRDRLSDNLAALDELRSQLDRYGRRLEDVPVVLQYNHRDEADDLAVEELHRKIGLRAAAFEAIAPRGIGVLESLTTISKRVIRNRREASGLTQPAGSVSLPPSPIVAPLSEPTPSDSIELDSTQRGLRAPIPDAESTIPEEHTTPAEELTAPAEEQTFPEVDAALPSVDLDPEDDHTVPGEHTIPEDVAAAVPAVDETRPAAPPDSVAQAVDTAARRAERLFDDHWESATGGFDQRTAAPEPLELQIIGAGPPELQDGKRLRLTLRLVDQDGRQGDCTLTLDLSALTSD